jgi:hypothetical protein
VATELLETAAMLTWEMKPYDMVSSLRGTNTLFQGQQRIKTGQRKETQKRDHRTDHRREIKERPETQIKEDARTRAEEPGPL